MKLQSLFFAGFVFTAFTGTVSDAQSASSDYSISTQSIDAGGMTVSSTGCTINASVGAFGGMASEAVTCCVVKGGYAGQLYDVVGLVVSASTTSVMEGTSLQLGAAQLLDDSTCLILSSTAPVWSVTCGPVASISISGLATAALVYQNCPATVGASFLGMSGSLSLTIINTNNDDYGNYAGNSQLEDWLVQYFGPPPNANAGPSVDTDGTGQTNLFKYIAGLNPLDPAARFAIAIQPVPDQPGEAQIIFTPVVAGRTYTVVSADSLTNSNWVALSGTMQSDNGEQRTVTDLNAKGSSKFYRVQISLP